MTREEFLEMFLVQRIDGVDVITTATSTGVGFTSAYGSVVYGRPT